MIKNDIIKENSIQSASSAGINQHGAGKLAFSLKDNRVRSMAQKELANSMAGKNSVQRKENKTNLHDDLKSGNLHDNESLKKEEGVTGRKPHILESKSLRHSIQTGPKDGSGNTIQRKISITYGANGDEPLEPSTPEQIENWLSANGQQVDPAMRRKIYLMARDPEDRVYHGIFDDKQLVKDINEFELAESHLNRLSFALFKLLGPVDGPGYDGRKRILDGAASAIIQMNITGYHDYASQGYRYLGGSDFPGFIWGKTGQLIINNILGTGRLNEIRSYLGQIGIHHIIVQGTQDPRQIIAIEMGPVLPMLQGKKIVLSVLPFSIGLKALNDSGAHATLLYMTGRGSLYSYMAFVLNGITHLIVDIKWANGILIKDVLQVLRVNGTTFNSVNLHGIAGSLTPAIPRDTMVIPRGDIHSLDPAHPRPVHIPYNNVFLPGALITMDHGNVSSILEEDDQGIQELLSVKQIHTLEMEAYHMIQHLEETGYDGEIKIVFTISDVATSPHENISIPPPRNAATLEKRTRRDNMVIKAFGLSHQ